MSTLTGRVLKTYNGYYYVLDAAGHTHTCKVKGKMKQRRFVLATGDWVEVETGASEGMIIRTLPRKNLLQRPLVANVDCLMAVFACKNPDPNPLLVDKLLALAEVAHIPAALVFNKSDMAPKGLVAHVKELYEPLGYQIFVTRAREGEGLEPLRSLIQDHTVVFGGPSGVGKSTLLKHLDPRLALRTGQVSNKIGRGRHTTRFAQLLPFAGGFLVDTPGFGNINLAELSIARAEDGFREIKAREGLCRFTGCSHTHEPGCEVKKAVEEGNIAASRYTSYCMIRQELTEAKKRG